MEDVLNWLTPWWRDLVPWAPLIALGWSAMLFRPVRKVVLWSIGFVLLVHLLRDEDPVEWL